MMKWIGMALAIWMVGVSSAIAAPAAAQKAQSTPATDFDLRGRARHHHHDRYADRRNDPVYYGRPTVYAPAPFVPIPPFFGYGWEWW